MNRVLLPSILLFTTVFTSSNALSQNLITNGDFEAGLSGWTTWAAPPSGFWNGVWIQANDCDIFIPTPCPYEGTTSFSQKKGSGAGNAHGGIYQVIDVTPGQTYDVSGFWSGGAIGNADGNGSWWELTVYDGAVSDVVIDAAPGPSDTEIAKVERNNLASNENFQFEWESFEGSFVANSSQVTVAFKNGSFFTFDAAGYLDQFTVSARPPVPVPVMGGAALLLLLLSMLGLVAGSRRDIV